MAEKYSKHLIDRMSMDETSKLLGEDYRDFRGAGGTKNDIYEIINGHKTYEEVIGFPPSFAPSDLTEAEIQTINQRSDQRIWGFPLIFALTIAFGCFMVVSLSPSTPIAIVFLIIPPLVVLIFMQRLRRRKPKDNNKKE